MREIKFRGWDKKWKTMTAPVTLEDIRKGFDGLKNCAVMQYTGLKDKNGKDVYEGDILKWFYEPENKEFIIGPVKWRDEVAIWAFDIGIGLNVTEPEDLFIPNGPYEIIGNIYENPELLQDQ